MLRLLVAIPFAVFSSFATAFDVPTPPAQYDHVNYNMRVTTVALKNIEMVCVIMGADLPRSGQIFGCAKRYAATFNGRGRLVDCDVVIPKEVTGAFRAAIIRHERGHCNGWDSRAVTHMAQR